MPGLNMKSVGTLLRDARIKKGHTLEDVNARTRISLKNLNAIESDDLSKISSPFTYRSFVKQIAEMIGVDYATLALDVQTASTKMPEPLVPGQEEELFVRPHQFRQVKPKRNLTWVYRTASIAAIAGAISGYLIWRNGGIEAAKEPASSLPAASEVLTPAKPSSAGQPVRTVRVSRPAAPIQVTSRADANSEPRPTRRPPAPGTEELLPPDIGTMVSRESTHARVQTVSQTSLQTFPAPAPDTSDATIHIELSAIEPTWLSILSDGKTTYTGVLEAMQTKVFDGKETARIRTANAGGVNIIFNGKALGPLGRHGQTRTFVFTKSGYEVVQGASTATSHFNPSGE
jgi:cytoskeletal protein RodZ